MGLLRLRKLGAWLRRVTGRARWSATSPLVACNVNKFPSIVCPATVFVDVPDNFTYSLYGGDFGLGEAGCPVVRHELRFVATGGDPDTGEILDSWSQTVLTSVVGLVRSATMTWAQWNNQGQPAVGDFYIRSYTPGDLTFKEDWCVTSTVNPV